MRSLPVWLYPANILTWLRFLAVPAVVVAILRGRYDWALYCFVAAGVSDGFDGWLARRFHQQSDVGVYADPLADKLLLSTLFIVLAHAGVLPWLLTILVFTRDFSILSTALIIYFRTGFRDFRPSWWGKANTVAELATVGFTMLLQITPHQWIVDLVHFGWVCVFTLAYVSGIHYAFLCAERFHEKRSDGSLAAAGGAPPRSRIA